tara:strand:- start:534 stop:1442 length:909 start_codon:yes stop_codon:yes gene_type:complete
MKREEEVKDSAEVVINTTAGSTDPNEPATETQTETTTTATETQTETSEPSQEPSAEPVIEGVGGYVHYYLRQLACPACMGESQELLVEFTAKFHEPISDSHTSWLPALGQCTNQLIITSPSANSINVGPFVTVQGSPHSFVANNVGNEYYAYLFETEYDRNTVHTVTLPNETESIQFMSVEGYDYIEPFAMLYVDPSYAFAAPIYRSGMTFTWSPYDTSRIYMIMLAVYTYDGSQLLGYAACVGADQGFMTMPSSVLQSFPSGGLVAIHLSRHKISSVPYEPLGSYIETHMEWEVVGTGFIQ